KEAIQAEMRLLDQRLKYDEWQNLGTYYICTNLSLNPKNREEIANIVNAHLDKVNVSFLCNKDIEDYIRLYPKLRMSFPQLLTLADLHVTIESIVNRDVYNRSSGFIKQSIDDLQVFVPTKPYFDALNAFDRHDIIAIVGMPEVGKTMIARALGLAFLANNWEIYYCKNPHDLQRLYIAESRQLF